MSEPAPLPERSGGLATWPVRGDLTDALLEPVDAILSPADREEIARRLATGIRSLTIDHHRPVRITAYQLATPRAQGAPFRWTARRAARSIALAALGQVVSGKAPTVLDAVRQEIDRRAWGNGGLQRPGGRPGDYALDGWLGRLGRAGTSAVVAEATTWAFCLFAALDWGRLSAAAIGTADQWWNCPDAAGVGLRGRADLRVPIGHPPSGNGTAMAFLTTLRGEPGTSVPPALGLSALVGLLQTPPSAPVPARVVAWWPDCGRAGQVAVDRALMDSTVSAVVAAIARTVTGLPLSDGGHPSHR